MSSGNEPSKTAGEYHSMKGTFVGSVSVIISLSEKEHAAGEAEYNAARAKGYAEGTADRIGGKKDSIVREISNWRQIATGVWYRHYNLGRTSLLIKLYIY
ncbi:hypothetical protein M422DRAFT_260862 [Sphaerobolus stellatus SS14]|uniref:Uncharacterized protein n=1 Tax=Sphaerobolus stellatus (strain SS14) TaxID=990650 RepID=A0A0C9VHF0_SPHS4|nr:hypothetical protein M422DRAFT_260862 [Sphaerobolus stellatus SS14]